MSGQNDFCFVDTIHIYILLNEYYHILIQISLKWVPKGPTDNQCQVWF